MLSVSISKEKNVRGAQEGLFKRYLNKPLYKRKFYLDVRNGAVASKLEEKIKDLGGVVELFLIKDVKSVITDKEEFGTSIKHFNSPIRNAKDEVRPKTRADAMLAKVRPQYNLSTKDPLEEAKAWGISILSVEKAFVWLNKVEVSVKLSTERKKVKIIELKTPCLKFEAFDRKTRPVFQEIPNWPSFNLNGIINEPAFICRSLREHNMTRKTRVNNVKAKLLQTGYCEACRIEYSYLEEHLKSDKHQDFVNDTNNFNELDTLISDGCNISSFLKINGIPSFEKYYEGNACKTVTPRKMPRMRSSTICDRRKPPISPTTNDSGHNLRTRRKTNSLYNTISSQCGEEVVLKPTRELRSSTRSSSAALKMNSIDDSDTWSSGRPKRSCIKQKRVSADERLVFDNKTYYRVEVLSNKLRSSTIPHRSSETPKVQTNSNDGQEDKGLIVKFRKMRYSELARLNDEAENFLFPRRGDSSSEEEDEIYSDNVPNTSKSYRKNESSLLLSTESDTKSSKVKNEEDHSMDSNCSEYTAGQKKKRRTQAEAFIADNQKYYKFEMPGSRLRYQGSYLSPISVKNNGECLENVFNKSELCEEHKNIKVELDDIKFSFEMVPKSEPWYQTFKRQDNGEEFYFSNFSDSGYWKPFLLPYEIGPLPPVDPQICLTAYKKSQKYKSEIASEKENQALSENTSCFGECTSVNSKLPLAYEPALGKAVQSHRGPNPEYIPENRIKNFKKPGQRRKGILLPSRNPRKSPRQHASTLAILSSIIHQRKRKEGKNSRSPDNSKTITSLSNLPEAKKTEKVDLEEDYDSVAKALNKVLSSSLENVHEIHLEEENTDEVNLKFGMRAVDMLESYVEAKQNNSNNAKITELDDFSVKSSPGRKCGRKKKKNRTGWPNKNRRVYLKKEYKEDNDFSEQESMTDSPTGHLGFENQEDDDGNENQLVTSKNDVVNNQNNIEACKFEAENQEQYVISVNNNDQSGDKQGNNAVLNGPLELKQFDLKCRERKSSSDSFADLIVTSSVADKTKNDEEVNVDLEKWKTAEKMLNARFSNKEEISNDKQLQPIVRVEKLDNEEVVAIKRERLSNLSPRRTNKRPRRMPASPKSPRLPACLPACLPEEKKIKEISKMLVIKEKRAEKIASNIQCYIVDYEVISETEEKLSNLERVRDELLLKLDTNEELTGTSTTTTTSNNVKGGAAAVGTRKKRFQELGIEIEDLRKKIAEHVRLIRLKEKDEVMLQQLQNDIQSMKHMKVKLIRKMEQQADKFKQWRRKRELEVSNLKEQEMKKRHMEVMETMYSRKQNVLERKVDEDVAAINKSLLDTMEQTGACLQRELDVFQSVVEGKGTEAKNGLKMLFQITREIKNDLKNTNTQVQEVRQNLSEVNFP